MHSTCSSSLPRLALLLLLLLITATQLFAQQLGDLPPCAIDCAVTAATSAGCSPTCSCVLPCFFPCEDLSCVCKSQGFMSSTQQCIASSSCSSSDQQLAQSMIAQKCGSAPFENESLDSHSPSPTASSLPSTPGPFHPSSTECLLSVPACSAPSTPASSASEPNPGTTLTTATTTTATSPTATATVTPGGSGASGTSGTAHPASTSTPSSAAQRVVYPNRVGIQNLMWLLAAAIPLGAAVFSAF